MNSLKFRRGLRNLEQYLSNQVEQREDETMAAHMAGVNASIGKRPKRRQGRAEPMPYRLRIAIAFASLASAVFSLYWWYP